MAAIESNLMIRGTWTAAGDTGEPDCAEYHLDWWNGFNMHNNEDLVPPTGEGLTVHYGGDYRVASAYIARLDGAVRDIDGQSFNEPPLRHSSGYRYYYVRDIEWFTIGDDLSGIDTVKAMLMRYGAMGTCLACSFTNEFHMQYQPPQDSIEPNHAVAIIGWNDTITTQAPKSGAWLCKNSWGPGNQINGCFWISYYDKHAARKPEMGAVSFKNVEPLRYSGVYYHDTHGWRDTKNGCTEAFNAFTAVRTEYLSAASFFTADGHVAYTLKVFDRFHDSILVDELASVSGTFLHSGFHTVDFPKAVRLSRGDRFYIYLYLSKGGHPYDRTSIVPVLLGRTARTLVKSSAQPNQSFYRDTADTSRWIDFYGYDDPSGYKNTGNFCIKGLVVTDVPIHIPVIETHAAGKPPVRVACSRVSSKAAIRYTLAEKSVVTFDLYTTLGKKIAALFHGQKPGGDHVVYWDGRESGGKRVSAGMYYIRVRVKTEKGVTLQQVPFLFM